MTSTLTIQEVANQIMTNSNPSKILYNKKYYTDEERKRGRYESHRRTYEKRGYLTIKIKAMKKRYGLNYPDQVDYVEKSPEELIALIERMSLDVEKLQKEKKLHKLLEKQKKIEDQINYGLKPKFKRLQTATQTATPNQEQLIPVASN